MDDAKTTAEGKQPQDLDMHFMIEVDGILYLAKAFAEYDDKAAENDEQKRGVRQARDLFEKAGSRLCAVQVREVRAFSGQRTQPISDDD